MDWRTEAERLEKEAKRAAEAFEYHKKESARKSQQIDELIAQIYSLRVSLDQPRPTSPNQKAWNSLLKLTCGMAIAVYNFNPLDKRGTAISEIQNDLDLKGIRLDADTIRKRLREAAELPEIAEVFKSKTK